jgi:hypothetical protein
MIYGPVVQATGPYSYSALGASRTHDLRFRKPMLYPLSYERVLAIATRVL